LFNHMMNNSITLKTVTSRDSYDNPTTTSSTIVCKLKYKNRVIKNSQGQDVNVMAEFTTATAITINNLVTISGKDWQILQVTPVYDFGGNILHYKGYI